MKHRLRCLIMLGVLLFPLTNQTEVPAYHLHHVTFGDYVAALPTLLPRMNYQSDVDTISDDLIRRYFDESINLDFAQLHTAYQKLLDYSAFSLSDLDLTTWNRRIIRAWLREHPIDLDTVTHLEFGDYKVDVMPRDFKGDGGHEWLLTINFHIDPYTNQAGNYLIAERDGRGGYVLTTTPLPWLSTGFHYSSFHSGKTQALLFQDINGDGIPEWVFAFTIGMNLQTYGWLYILEWHNGKLEQLLTGNDTEEMSYSSAIPFINSALPGGVTIEFTKALNQPAIDITIHQERFDNWGCTWVRTRIIGWNDSGYILKKSGEVYADSPGCAWRNAEANTWKGNYQAAISYYEHGLTFTHDHSDEQVELNQYMRLRLALAYSLSGDDLAATKLLSSLSTEKPASKLMEQLISRVTSLPTGDVFSRCLAAYRVFDNYRRNDSDYLASTKILIGLTLDNFIPQYLLAPDPSHAGCDISAPLLAAVQHHSFKTTDNPAVELGTLGLTTAKAFVTDLNNDGDAEWLIWLSVQTPPLFFGSDANIDTYNVSYAPLTFADKDAPLTVRLLPDESGKALAIESDTTDYSKKCPPSSWDSDFYPVPNKVFRLWRIEAGKLFPILETPYCDTTSSGTPFQMLYREKLYTSISGWGLITDKKPDYPADYTQVDFQWDSIQKIYKPPAVVLISPNDSIPEHVLHRQDILGNIAQAFESRDYRAALKAINAALLSPCKDCQNDDYLAMHYWRATALELNGDDSAALAEYVFIYTSSPTEFWRLLAGLHLEPFF